VHLSHGQILNRQQLACIVRSIDGAAAVIGDYNAVGPVLLPGFRDVGPRAPTHVVRNVLPFRLDRCLVRGVLCADACVLERGSSDHRPIMIELAAAQQSVPIYAGRLGAARRRSVKGRIARTALARIWNGLGAKSGLRLSMRRAVGKLSSGLIVAGSSKRLRAYTAHRNRAIAGKETA
jgi:hypothetical protein